MAIGSAVVAALAIAAFELLAVQSIHNESARTRQALAKLRDENAKTERMVADYDAFKRSAEQVDRDFDVAIAAVPEEAELASALEDVERVTAAAGVNLVRFTPSAAARGAKPATKAAGGVALGARPVAILVRSSFSGYRDLLDRLATYPRLLTVERFAMRSSPSEDYSLEASITLNCYYKKAGEIAAAPKTK
jgi:Tfp pilus assembly protein PilO